MKDLSRIQTIERSLIKKYRSKIWRPFVIAVDRYKLVEEGDKIAVCISGGKDSFLTAKCFMELKRRSPVKFDLVFLTMNPGFDEYNLDKIKENAEILGIDLKTFDTDIFQVVAQAGGSPCYLCARMRRGYLYKNAQELGCNKIALGHHFDDVIETLLLSQFYGAEYKAMMPKLKSANFEGMQLIRPLYLIRERDIISWAKYNNLDFIKCGCSVALKTCQTAFGSKRGEIKWFIEQLEKIYPNIPINIFNASQNVNLDAILGYKEKGEKHSFLDTYNEVQDGE